MRNKQGCRARQTEFEQAGFLRVPDLLPEKAIEVLTVALEVNEPNRESASRRDGAVYGRRNLLRDVPAVREIVQLPEIRQVIVSLLGEGAVAVRGLYFDKTPEANWPVPWHQDRTIAIAERRDIPGFGPWSIKNGVLHVQPPTEILENMVALRLHLDSCDADNGPLRVLPATHLRGKLGAEAIQQLRRDIPEVTCTMNRGDGLLMRPLLLHASGETTGNARHRRVLHIEWAAKPLPGGLRWYDAV